MTTPDDLKLTAAQVRRKCSLDHFTFKTTAEITVEETIIGQPRGVRAIEFGIDIDKPGFNVFVLGPTGSGRTTAIRRFVEYYAAKGDTPQDWAYVQNFNIPHRPRAISFAPGEGTVFVRMMNELVERLALNIPIALEDDSFTEAMDKLNEEFGGKQAEIFKQMTMEAASQGLAIVRTPAGLLVVPTDNKGEPVAPEVLQNMGEEEKTALQEKQADLQAQLGESLKQARELDREHRAAVTTLRDEAAGFVVDQHVDDVKEVFGDHEEVLEYLVEVRADVLENLEDFSAEDDGEDEDQHPAFDRKDLQGRLKRYTANLIVDHSDNNGAPVIVEDLPTYSNLVGRIEGEVEMGALSIDFSMIRAGALHRANGGFLILKVSNLFSQPGAWEGLKRALHSAEIRMEESMIRSGLGILTPQTIDPEPIPLHVKVILLGTPKQYYMLYGMEEDFSHLFKIKADFASFMERTHENEDQYAHFIAARCKELGLPPFSREAVGALVEHGSRMMGHQNRLSTLFGEVTDVITEAGYWANKAGAETVLAEHVASAIEEARYRANLYEERTLASIEEQTIYIATEGEVVGQVNGLSVVGLGDYSFGQPSRITARVYTGKAGVVNIEREVELSGPIHDKGVLILQGYLGGHYAAAHPLSLSASITFEQSYGGVDGDSASSTELFALLSALSGYPIRQRIAVTGSVNQMGQIQPIGGATEKVEGFFRVCQSRGLTGDQGVMIPKANIPNLMLDPEVTVAVREGKFHIWAIETVDQGIELLTGTPVAKVHQKVASRLKTLWTAVKDQRGE